MRKFSKARADFSHASNHLKVSVFWGDLLYDTAICHPGVPVTIGQNRKDTFILDLASMGFSSSFKLAEVSSENVADFFFSESLSGHIRIGDDFFSLQEIRDSEKVNRDKNGIYRAPLSLHDQADIVVGLVSFYIEWIPNDPSLTLPRSPFFEKRHRLILALFAALFLLTFFVLQMGLFLSEEKPPERLVEIISKPLPAKAAIGSRLSSDGGAQSGDMGKAASVPAEKPSAASLLRQANLGSLVSGLTSLGSQAPSVKSDANKLAAAAAEAGTGGFTTAGLKAGGGGQSVGIGRTVGQGEGGFEGTGRLGLSGDSPGEGSAGYGEGETVETGGLDRNLIDAIIKRRQDRIRLCYERQLNFNPKLSGKVTIHFVIIHDGTVADTRILEDTMHNDSIQSCILTEVGSWGFPKPQGGTKVNVDYPFVFESSAQAH